jgi:hypothetical protein
MTVIILDSVPGLPGGVAAEKDALVSVHDANHTARLVCTFREDCLRDVGGQGQDVHISLDQRQLKAHTPFKEVQLVLLHSIRLALIIEQFGQFQRFFGGVADEIDISESPCRAPRSDDVGDSPGVIVVTVSDEDCANIIGKLVEDHPRDLAAWWPSVDNDRFAPVRLHVLVKDHRAGALTDVEEVYLAFSDHGCPYSAIVMTVKQDGVRALGSSPARFAE